MSQDLYFEDFTLGRVFETAGVTLTEAEIISFALAYDPQPFHIDAIAAAESPYGGLIASGFHTLALGFRMFHQTGAITAASMGGSGLDELRWHLPVRPGDTLRLTVEVVAAEPSKSRPDRGRARLLYRQTNQHGELVASWIATHIFATRPGATEI